MDADKMTNTLVVQLPRLSHEYYNKNLAIPGFSQSKFDFVRLFSLVQSEEVDYFSMRRL